MIEWKTLQMYLALFAVYILGSWYYGFLNEIVAFAGIGLIGMIFFYYEFFVFRKYPVIVPMFIMRKGRWSFMLDRASRRKDKNGVDYYHLKNTKKDAKPPKFGNIIETLKGYVLPLFSPSQDEYRELNMDSEGKINVMDEDMKAWYKYNIKKAYSDWAPELSNWVRYQPIIYMAVLGGIVIVILYIITGELGNMAAAMSSAANQLMNAVNTMPAMSTPPH